MSTQPIQTTSLADILQRAKNLPRMIPFTHEEAMAIQAIPDLEARGEAAIQLYRRKEAEAAAAAAQAHKPAEAAE